MPPNQIESTEPTLADGKRQWLSQDVMLISLSACFADLGYQTVLAVFPLFLVVTLKLPVWVFALAMAVSFGPGALFGLWGGKIADRIGAKKAALGGNLLIPLLSLPGEMPPHGPAAVQENSRLQGPRQSQPCEVRWMPGCCTKPFQTASRHGHIRLPDRRL